MTYLTAKQRDALEMMKAATRGSFDAFDLMGPAMATRRQEIMSALSGAKLPKAQCGVNALRDRLYQQFQIAGDCPSNRLDAFRAFAETAIR